MLLIVFALLTLRLLLAGAEVFRSRNDADRDSYQWRTTAQYLANKLRQLPSTDALRVEFLGDGDALVITEELDGTAYQTWIYSHDGWIRELFCAEGFQLTPESGEKILPGRILDAELSRSLLTLTAEDGRTQPVELRYALRGGDRS